MGKANSNSGRSGNVGKRSVSKVVILKKRINSRAKGAAGERELANYFKARGHDARRGQQFSGGTDSPDVVLNCPALAGFHIECKRVEAGNLYTWLAQASKDAGATKIPLVVHRRNKKEWVAILPLEALISYIDCKDI